MKIKNKGKSGFLIPQTYFAWQVFALVCVVASLTLVILRTIQLTNYINFSTGFYNGSSGLSFALNATLVVFGIVFAVLAYIDRNEYAIQLDPSSCKRISVVSLVLAVLMIANGLMDMWSILTTRGQKTDILVLLLVAMSILAGLSFIYQAFSIKLFNKSSADVLYAVPCIWACLNLISMFVQHTVVITVSENLYNILRMVCVVVFFLTSAKHLAGYAEKGNGRWLVFSGIMSVIFSLMTTVPLFIALIQGKRYTVDHIIRTDLLDFGIMIYMIVFIFSYLKGRRQRPNYRYT